MAKASLIKEIMVKVENKVGMMSEVSDIVANSGANITALNAFGIDKNAIFRIVTSDNAKAIAALKAKDIAVSERDAVSVSLEDKPGAAAGLGEKIKAAGIDIKYIYGSVCGCAGACMLILNCSDNKKAVEALG